jgi:hypothetical protein
MAWPPSCRPCWAIRLAEARCGAGCAAKGGRRSGWPEIVRSAGVADCGRLIGHDLSRIGDRVLVLRSWLAGILGRLGLSLVGGRQRLASIKEFFECGDDNVDVGLGIKLRGNVLINLDKTRPVR